MTYFKQLKPIADRVMKYYTDDFYVHDKQNLDDLKHPAIWAVRRTGSDLFHLERSESVARSYMKILEEKQKRINGPDQIKEQLKLHHWQYMCICHEERNTKFYYLVSEKVKPVSQRRAVEIADDYLTYLAHHIHRLTEQRELVPA